MIDDRSRQRLPWQPVLSELIGTALLVLVGLSLVILMGGAGSPVVRVISDEGLRRLITGFLNEQQVDRVPVKIEPRRRPLDARGRADDDRRL